MRSYPRSIRKGIWGLSLSTVLLAATSLTTVVADDWPQWQGPTRDGRWQETGILSAFPAEGPKVLWRAEVAHGYSGPAVAGGKVFLSDFVKSEGDDRPNPGKKSELSGVERVHCLDANTGTLLWKHEYPCQYKLSYPNGPRATPAVDGGHVFVLGAEGHLCCLSIADGKVVWDKELKKEYGLELAPHWGFAAHPLVHGDRLFCVVGGEGSVAVAFDKKTGKELWRALSATEQGYCPPTIIQAGGVEQLLIWHSDALNSLNPATGEVYWSFPLKPAYAMSIIAPIHVGEHLYTTALQGTSLLLKLDPDKPAATEVWREHGVHPDHNPPLVVDGHIYGIDEAGQLRCFSLETGERLWEDLATATDGRPANSTTGFMVENNGRFFIFTEQGLLLLAKLSPQGYEELGRAKILEPTARTGNRQVVWSHPAFAQKCMFARNDKELVCVSLAEK